MPRRARRPSTNGGYQPGQNPGGGAGTQAPAAPVGLPYGQHQATIQAQQAMPLPAGAPAAPSPAAGAPGGGLAQALAAAQAMAPPQGGLTAPTARPSEPVTAGLPIGAGPGTEVLGGIGPNATALAELRAVYQLAPNDDLLQIIMRLEQQDQPRGLH